MKPAVSISGRHGRRWRARSCSTRWSTAPATAGSIEGWQITLPLLARLRLKQQVAIPSTCTLSILQDVAPSCPEGIIVGSASFDVLEAGDMVEGCSIGFRFGFCGFESV